MARPGIMVYFDIMEPLKKLPDADKGRLFWAMLEYGKTGIVPEFDGVAMAIAWEFVKPKIDKDEAEYNLSVKRRQFATVCRERKKKGEQEITFDEWLKTIDSGEYQTPSMMTNDNQLYPTTTTPTTTSTTKKTAATTAAAATTSTTEPQNAAATADKQLKLMNGELGKGVVMLTDEQVEDLLDKLGLDSFDYYVDKLSSFIIKNGAKVKNHYETILNWYRQDSGVRG